MHCLQQAVSCKWGCNMPTLLVVNNKFLPLWLLVSAPHLHEAAGTLCVSRRQYTDKELKNEYKTIKIKTL